MSDTNTDGKIKQKTRQPILLESIFINTTKNIQVFREQSTNFHNKSMVHRLENPQMT